MQKSRLWCIKTSRQKKKGIIFKFYAPFTDCISNINNAKIENAGDMDVVMPMYNLIKYRDNYSKTSGSLWQHYRDVPVNTIQESDSFKYKIKITGNTPNNDDKKNAEIAVPLKYLSNFWRTLEILLINCEINLIWTWPESCVISSETGKTKFAIADTKSYVPVITLSTEYNIKLMKQLESSFKRIINWKKDQSKLTDQEQNICFDYLSDRSFQGVNILFVLLLENRTDTIVHTGYYFSKVEIKD